LQQAKIFCKFLARLEIPVSKIDSLKSKASTHLYFFTIITIPFITYIIFIIPWISINGTFRGKLARIYLIILKVITTPIVLNGSENMITKQEDHNRIQAAEKFLHKVKRCTKLGRIHKKIRTELQILFVLLSSRL
jgi:hypothetical protein